MDNWQSNEGWICRHREGSKWKDGCCTHALAEMVSLCGWVQAALPKPAENPSLLKFYFLRLQSVEIPGH